MADPNRSATHLVLIPSYNPGRKVFETVHGARQHWNPVWVVVDGSTDGTGEALQAMAQKDPGLRVLVQPKNSGKGSAVLAGATEALRLGFTHVTFLGSGVLSSCAIPNAALTVVLRIRLKS